ncbi:MAG TPA: hypothetical protein VH853_12820 [Polyangia bacterium]|jgi:hypothetical protein|nr:hypothetical protein [Polyangia bacterium]
MGSRRFSVWQKVVALAPLLLLAVYLPGQMMLRCRIDGQLRPLCCCPQAEKTQETGPVVKAQDCCERELSVSQRPAVEPDQRAAELVLAPSSFLAALPSAAPLAEPDRSDSTWQAQGPPRDGPPIVLLKHAFLI